MKRYGIHSIYLSIIALLAYLTWIKSIALENAKSSLVESASALKADFNMMEQTFIIISTEIERSSTNYQNPSNIKCLENSRKAVSIQKSFSNFIENCQLACSDSKSMMFSDKQIQTLKDSLKRYDEVLCSLTIDSTDRSYLSKKYNMRSLVGNDTFWQRIKSANLDGVLNQLEIVKNQAHIDNITFLRYNQNITGGTIIDGDWGYRIGIIPKKINWVEGEKFEADLFLLKYSDQAQKQTMKVNGKEIPVEKGVGHYVKENLTTKDNRIDVELSILNPYINETKLASAGYEYHVLPKCCQTCK